MGSHNKSGYDLIVGRQVKMRELLQTCKQAVVKPVSGCVHIACSQSVRVVKTSLIYCKSKSFRPSPSQLVINLFNILTLPSNNNMQHLTVYLQQHIICVPSISFPEPAILGKEREALG